MKTVKEMADEKGVTIRHIYLMIKQGKIPAGIIRRRNRGNPRFKESAYQREIAIKRERGKLERAYKNAYKKAQKEG